MSGRMYSDGNCVAGGDFLAFVDIAFAKVVCFGGVVLPVAMGEGALFSRILDLIFKRNIRRSGSFALSFELSLCLLSAIVGSDNGVAEGLNDHN